MADPQQQSGFDVNAARQAGYSDDEILGHLTQTRNFDVNGALSAGYSKADIIDHLSSTPSPGSGSPSPSAWDIQQENAHQTRMSALAGLTGMPTPNMSEQDRASFAKGKAAGAISVPVVAGAATAAEAGAIPPFLRALTTVGKKYGIKALEGAGLGAGWQLYKEVKKQFEPDEK